MKKVKKAMAVNQSAENKIKTVAGLTEALAYITNPAKIYEVSRINCSGSNSNTLEQFRLLRLAFNQNKGIIAHHFIPYIKEKMDLDIQVQKLNELKEANLELKKVVRKQARQIDELNAKLYPDTKSNSQKDDMYPTL